MRSIRVPAFPMEPRKFGMLWADARGLRVDTSDGLRVRDLGRVGECLHSADAQGYTLFSLLGVGQLRDHLGDTRVAAKRRHTRTLKLYLDFELDADGAPDVRSGLELTPLAQFNNDGPEGIWPWFEWAQTKGVPAASIGQMGWNLWLTTMQGREPLEFMAPRRGGQLAREALIGGRKETHPEAPGRTFNDCQMVDLSAAYPRAMAAAPYPVGMQKMRQLPRRADWPEVGLGVARVTLPAMIEWGPLPVRVLPRVVSYVREPETVEGCWTFTDLRLAADKGARVELLEAWKGVGYRDLFGPWYELMAEARSLPGQAGRVAKYAANVLWGRFCMNADEDVRIVTQDGKGNTTFHQAPGQVPPTQSTAHISAETAARVRDKLARDCLYELDALYCDTDGAIVPATQRPPGAAWSVKQTMPEVEIRASQVYRHTCDACLYNLAGTEVVNTKGSHRGPHYSIAGLLPSDDPAVVFDGWPVGVPPPMDAELYELTAPAAPTQELIRRYGRPSPAADRPPI